MNIPKELQPYITDNPAVAKNSVIKEVNTIGVYEFFINHKHHIDLTTNKFSSSINFIYKIDITKFIVALSYVYDNNLISKDEVREYLNNILEIHKNNLEYEKVNPPIDYYKNVNRKTTKNKIKRNAKEKSKKPVK